MGSVKIRVCIYDTVGVQYCYKRKKNALGVRPERLSTRKFSHLLLFPAVLEGGKGALSWEV